MSYARLKQRLDAGEVLLLDGPTGTELQRRGAAMDPAAWCGPATLQHDRLLTEIHADYIAAGAAVVTANTYASSRLMLSGAGLADRVDEINRRAVAAALRARDAAPGAEVVVAGSLSHMVPVSAGTADVDLRRVPSDAAVADALGELARILKSAGAELILLEMMYHPGRTRLALAAALETGLPVWFGLSARRAADGRLVAFHHAEDLPLDDIAGLIPAAGVDAAGVMHTSAELVEGSLAVVRRHFAGPLMAYPDSGYFESPDWRFVDSMSPARFEQFCRGWISCGVQLIGGCCGLSVEHIRAAARARDIAAPLTRL
jgi:methionine synthase I (cobalamin-dependent)